MLHILLHLLISHNDVVAKFELSELCYHFELLELYNK